MIHPHTTSTRVQTLVIALATILLLTGIVAATAYGGTIIGIGDGIASKTETSVVSFLFEGKGGEQEVKTCEEPKSLCNGKSYELLASIAGGATFSGASENETAGTTNFLEPINKGGQTAEGVGA